MNKNTELCINLKTILQDEPIAQTGKCYRGVLSRKNEDQFLFEEAVPSHVCHRNDKLYEGKYCSLVHMQNGRYQIHMKTIDASAIDNREELAFKVYHELIQAFQVID